MTVDTFLVSVEAEIEANKAKGPVCLTGYSMGGQVAWAIASALSDASCLVQHVALLDVEADPTPQIATPASWPDRFHRAARAIGRSRTMTEAGRLFGRLVMRLDRLWRYPGPRDDDTSRKYYKPGSFVKLICRHNMSRPEPEASVKTNK